MAHLKQVAVTFLLVLASTTAVAEDFVQSGVLVSGLVRRNGCENRQNAPGFDCSGGPQTNVFFEAASTDTPLDEVSRVGSALEAVGSTVKDEVPGGFDNVASAKAKTDLWVNRVHARATAATTIMENPLTSGFQLLGSEAQAVALSAYGTSLTFAGGSGVATLQVRLTGSVLTEGNEFGAFANIGFGLLVGPQAQVPDIEDAAGMFVNRPTGAVDELVSIPFSFQPLQPLPVVGLLVATATANTDFKVTDSAGVGGSDLYEDLGRVNAVLDFYGTAEIERLIVPVGVTVAGEGGSALPFAVVAVPEPSTYALFGIGILAIVTGARRTRNQSR